jgi:hypothetical protein
VEAAKIRPFGLMDVKGLLKFFMNILEIPGLDPCAGHLRIPVHRIATPEHNPIRLLHGAQKRRQSAGYHIRTEPMNQREPARFICRIQTVDESEKLVRPDLRPNLDSDGIGYAPKILDMTPV